MSGAGQAAAVNYRAGGDEERPKATDRWRTPPELYARLDAEFRFALDAACDSDNRLAPRGLCRDQGSDGLLQSWAEEGGGGAVWCNPPYSNLKPWVTKAGLEGRSVVVVLLVPADTSTRWWRDLVSERAMEVRFITGRPRFLLPDGGEHRTKGGGGGLTVPSALVIFSPAGGPPRYSYIPHRLSAPAPRQAGAPSGDFLPRSLAPRPATADLGTVETRGRGKVSRAPSSSSVLSATRGPCGAAVASGDLPAGCAEGAGDAAAGSHATASAAELTTPVPAPSLSEDNER